MFWQVVLCGNRLNCWRTIPIWARAVQVGADVGEVCPAEQHPPGGRFLEEVHRA
jgi:hypothetical protein